MSQPLHALEYRMVLRHNMSQPLHAIEYRMVLTQYVPTPACYRIQDGANAICPNPYMLIHKDGVNPTARHGNG